MSESTLVSNLIDDAAQHGEPELESLAIVPPSLHDLIMALFDERIYLPENGWISGTVFVLITAYQSDDVASYKDSFLDIIGGSQGEHVNLRLVAMRLSAYFGWTESFRLLFGVISNPHSTNALITGAIEASISLLLSDPELVESLPRNYLAFVCNNTTNADSLVRMFVGRALFRLAARFPEWRYTIQFSLRGIGLLDFLFYPMLLLARFGASEQIETAYAMALWKHKF
jgi:hypothetical protein